MWHQKPLLGQQINRAHPLAKGLVSCWLMNENSGNRVYNLAGDIHGTITGADWTSRGLWFDETAGDNKIDFGTYDFTSWVELSIAMGVRYIETVQGAEYTLFSNWPNAGTTTAQILIRIEPSGDHLEAYIVREANTQVGGSFADIVFDNTGNTSNILVATFDTSFFRVYLDGIESIAPYATGSALDADVAVNNLQIGGTSHAAQDDFNGYIDFCYIWKKALTVDEIALICREPYAMLHQPSRTKYYFLPAAAGGNAPTGVLYGPLHGPLAGPI